ncbi:MAG TPA: hypothetical protein VF278_06845 [Pirellulales bacterium]
MWGVMRSALRISNTRRRSAADLQRPTTTSRFHATLPAMPFPFDATLKLRQGRKLLGVPGPSVETALSSIQDVERLERMAEAILTVKSWEELLSTS